MAAPLPARIHAGCIVAGSAVCAGANLYVCGAGGQHGGQAGRQLDAAGRAASAEPAELGRYLARRPVAGDGAQDRRGDHARHPRRPRLPRRCPAAGIPEYFRQRPRGGAPQRARRNELRLFLLCRARSPVERVCLAGRLHRRAFGAGAGGANGGGTGVRAVARDRPRGAAPHRAHAGPAAPGCPDAAGGHAAGGARVARGRRCGAGRVCRRPGPGHPAPAQLRPRRRTRGRPHRFPDHGRSRFRHHRHGGLLRPHAGGQPLIQRPDARLSADPPADDGAHRRHPGAHPRAALQAASGQPEFPPGPRACPRAAG